MEIVFPRLFFTGNRLLGERVENVSRTLGDLRGIFADVDAFSRMPQNILAYEVSSFLPEQEGTPGGLYFGITYLHPGKVGNEYFMTKGHFHANIDRAEFYWGLEGEGMLILMDQLRRVWAERVFPGAYIIYRVVWLTVWQIREILYFLLQLVGRLMQGIIIGKLPIMALQLDCWRSMGSLN